MSTRQPKPTARIGRAAWSRDMESRALQPPADAMERAAAQWQRIAPAQQLALARESAEARAPELVRAYRNLVHVTSGYRKRRAASGEEQLVPEPCIVFVVRRKWPASRSADPTNPTDRANPQRLPASLLAWDTVDGQRVLCAIPTDVQHEADLRGVRPSGASLGITEDPLHEVTGTLTCLIDVRSAGTRTRYAMSALHVLSPSPQIRPPALTEGNRFVPLELDRKTRAQPPVAATSEFGGALRDASAGSSSLDVQLARIAPGAQVRVRAALADMRLSPTRPFVTDKTMFERLSTELPFELVVPANHPDRPPIEPRPRMICHFSRWLNRAFSIPYLARSAGTLVTCDAVHDELVEMVVLGNMRPIPGDSGCALVVHFDDGSCALAGMFIASDEKLAFAYAIPAWQLLDPAGYFNLPDGAQLTLASP